MITHDTQNPIAALSVDPIQFRHLMRRFATGVTVLTVRDGDTIHGMTANSFTSVSLKPTLVLVCILNDGTTYQIVSRVGHFAVNVLSATQRAWAERFARQSSMPANPFGDIAIHSQATGAPIFDECIMFMDCRVVAAHPAGDHTIFVGEVLAMGFGKSKDEPPLIWLDGKYTTLVNP